MKSNWGNEHTRPDYEVKDTVYTSLMESCMVLENNKKVHDDVEYEMIKNYRDRID